MILVSGQHQEDGIVLLGDEYGCFFTAASDRSGFFLQAKVPLY